MPPSAWLEPPFAARLSAPVNALLLVPEHPGLQQGFIEGRTADGDERLPLRALSLFLEWRGRPAPAGPHWCNQDGRLGGRDRIISMRVRADRGLRSLRRPEGLSRIYPVPGSRPPQPGMIERPFQ